MANEIYALHYKGELVSASVWKEHSKNYGGQQLYGWRPPKKMYAKVGHARAALRHLPQAMQDDVEIMRYVPHSVVPHNKPA